MIAAKDNLLLSNFAGLHEKLGRNGHWLRDTREKAIARFNELGFPTTKLEEWKYTNVAPVARIPLEAAAFARDTITREKLRGSFLAEAASADHAHTQPSRNRVLLAHDLLDLYNCRGSQIYR